MSSLERIAVVGGGPAGALAAAQLAGRGREVLLFDEKLAWEKPCGGGLTDKALARWPFLADAQVERKWITECELIAPSGRVAAFRLDRKIAIFSRKILNHLLLERARASGAQLLRERVLKTTRLGGQWSIESSAGKYSADFLVLAAGARNALRSHFAERLGPENFMIAAGYFVPAQRDLVQIRFVEGLHGYLWIFPRADHLSAGICGRMMGKSTAELREALEGWLIELGISLEGALFYAHIIPSLCPGALRSQPLCGEGWALAGDAAGFVDAITGEGIYYALRSAELLVSALTQQGPNAYPRLLREDFLPELEQAARIADRFYCGKWLGSPVIEQMIRLTAHSGKFRDLMRDLFAGSQEYSGLRKRLYHSLPKIAAQAIASKIRGRAPGNAGIRLAGAGNRT
jgi:flavin-dependent dehydrogenase